MTIVAEISFAASVSVPVKIISGDKAMRATFSPDDIDSTGNRTISVILVDTFDDPVVNATVSFIITPPTGSFNSFTVNQTGTNNYTLNYTFGGLGYYNISISITRDGFPGISVFKRVYAGLVELSGFSNDESVYQGTVAYFKLTARNVGNVSSQIIPAIKIFNSGGTLVFSREGFATTIQGNTTLSLLQYNTLVFNVGSTAAGNYITVSYITFTDRNNNTFATPNRTSTLTILTPPSSASSTTATDTSTSASLTTQTKANVIVSTSVIVQTLSAEKPNIVKISNENVGIKEISLDVKNAASNVEIKVTKSDQQPASVEKKVEGKVYQYLEVKYEGLKEDNIRGAKVKFEVAKKWVQDNSLQKNNVVLKRYSGDQWSVMRTRLVSESASAITYEAELTGLSVFAIGEDTTQSEFLQFISMPILVEVSPGEQRAESIGVFNPADEAVNDIAVSVEGIPPEWFSVSNPSFSVEGKQSNYLAIVINIPPNAIPGNYQTKIRFQNADFTRDFIFMLRVSSLEQSEQLDFVITKSAEIKELEGETSFVIKVRNKETPATSLSVVEKIDKSIASSVDEIVFSQKPSRIIQPDPIVEFTFLNMLPFEQRNVTYSVKKIVNTTAPFVYSSIEQVITIEKIPELPSEQQSTYIQTIIILAGSVVVTFIIMYLRSRSKTRKEVKEIEKIIVKTES